MRKLLLIIFVFALTACSSNGDSRYRDNSELEHPPTVAVDKKDAETAAEQKEEPKRRHGKGLKSDAYMEEGSEVTLRIKRSYDESWILVNQALQLRELKIPDQDRSKGVFYVEFDGSGFLSQASSFFASDHKATTYLIKLTGEGEETEVTVRLANPEEQVGKNMQKGDDKSLENSSSNLTQVIFDTLQDEVKEE